jgi:hypothetical protein
MRTAFLALLTIHALLHLLGVLKSWGLAALPELSGRTIVALPAGALRALGVAWLLAGLTLLAAALLRGFRLESWWIAAAVGVVLSQALIILQWHDAKAGTLANVLIACVIALTLADHRLRDRVDQRLDLLLSDARAQRE